MTAVAQAETADLYDRIAADYQEWWAPVIAPAALHLLDLVAPTVADRPRARLVDVGAGTGTLARAAVARWPGIRATAVDPSPGMLAVGAGGGGTRPRVVRRASADLADRLGRAAAARRRQRGRRRCLRSRSSTCAAGSPPCERRTAVLRPGGTVAVVTWLAARLAVRALGPLQDRHPRAGSRAIGDRRSLSAVPQRAFRSGPRRRAGFRRAHAFSGIVEKQWTPDAYVACTFEAEDRDFVAALDQPTRQRLEARSARRLAPLEPSAFAYRDPVI